MENMDCPEEFKHMMMENDSDQSLENIPQTFICCVCRDLLYKPVALGCGHVSCFWCVQRSMTFYEMSSCPMCRNKYHHFPFVCQTLHFLLLKLYPSAYNKREKETLGDEQKNGIFSPEFDSAASVSAHQEDIATTSVSSSGGRDCNKVSVGDVLCGSCKNMLYRPVVLNCGHVFCNGCIVSSDNEMLRCEVCQYPHPEDFPKVCLEFDQFLEEQFSTEYKLRRADSLMKQKAMSSETPTTSSSRAGEQELSGKKSKKLSPLWNGSDKVHSGYGCDSCGMCPIVGDRYKCKNCVVTMSYDLCGDCYASGSVFPGRFNQNHTSDHEFELQIIERRDPLTVLREQINNISAITAALREASAMHGMSVDLSVFDDVIAEGDAAEDASLPSSETEENENND